MSTLVSILKKTASQSSAKLAYLFLKEDLQEAASITYQELDKKAREIAGYLQKKVTVGERVLLFFPTGIDFITAFFGCLYAGVIAVPAFCPRLDEFTKTKEFIQKISKDARIQGILTSQLFHNILKKNQSSLFDNPIFISDVASITVSDTQLPSVKIVPNTIAYLQYTSGSTSSPKAVIIRHKNLMHNLKYTGKAWHYSKNSISLTFASHAHVYGLVCGLLLPLYHNSKAIFMAPETFVQKPMLWLKAITKYRVTHSGCPNFGYDLCLKSENLITDNLNLRSWQVAVNGGEKVQYNTLAMFANKFNCVGFKLKNFCSAYGMSEMAGTIASGPYSRKPRIFSLEKDTLTLVGNGRLLNGIRALIVDPISLKPLKTGQIGEICLSGKSLTSGYWQADDSAENSYLTLPHSNKKYFRTGDLGFIKHNEICLTGRLKEVIIRYGKKYYPHDIERTLADALQQIVTTKQVVFSKAINNREEIFVLQEVNESQVVKAREIINLIRQAAAKVHGLDIYQVCLVKENSLPLSYSGKIQRKLSQQLFEEDKLPTIELHFQKEELHSMPTDLVEKFVADVSKIICSVFNLSDAQIDLQSPLSSYGLDSIKAVQFITAINETYQLAITPDHLYENLTFHEFINAVIKMIQNNFINTSQSSFKSTQNIEQNGLQDIAIIGMSGIFPGANDLTSFWDNLTQQKDVITEIPHDRWNWRDNQDIVKWGGFIENIRGFDANFFSISPREAEITDPQQRIFLQTVWKTIEDAGYAISSLAQKKVGLFVGVFGHDYAELLQKKGITDAYMTTGTTHSILANRVSYLLNLQGPSEAIDTACSSSLVAIHHSVRAIQHGDCELAIAGGVNALLTSSAYHAATNAGMLSADGRCKTFDKNANGYVRAEGVGAVLLKPLNLAILDGDQIYGVIKGTAVNHGGHVSSLTAPNPNAQSDAIVAACVRANISVDTLSYIETHGTGTTLGDPIEINGLKRAFTVLANEQQKKLPTHYCGLGSVKTAIGHLEAGAGIASLIKVLLCLKHKQLPGNLHFTELNPYIDLKESPFYIVDKTKAWVTNETPRRAGISSFGFGGTNAHVIIEEPPQPKNIEEIKKPVLLTLSAKTQSALQQKIRDLHHWLINQTEIPSLNNISYILNFGRDHFDWRAIIIAESVLELKATLMAMTEGRQTRNSLLKKTMHETISPIFQELCHNLTKEMVKTMLPKEEYRDKLLVLGNFYIEGYQLNFAQLHSGECQRISLPSYPFELKNYWLPENDAHALPEKDSDNIELNLDRVREDLTELVSNLLKINPTNLNQSMTLTEMGLDSISMKELTLRLENHFDIEITPAVFFTYNTIQSLSQYFHDAVTRLSARKTAKTISAITLKEKNSVPEPIAIIGMQGYFPQSEDLGEFWQHLIAGDDLISEVPIERWDWRDYYGDAKKDLSKTNSKWGGFLKDVASFDAGFFNISSREANLMDPQHRLFLEIVWRTIEDAGYNPFSLSTQNVGLFVGIEFNEYQTLISSQQKIFHGHLATGNSHALLANRISYFFNLHGPSEVINTACSSSLVAVHRAVNALRSGECKTVIVGGVSLMLSPETFIITSQMGALSPDGRCKTFDQSANGYVKGEGLAALLLKNLSEAEKDGDYIYGVIKGTAVNHGGKAQSLTAPNASAQTALLISAYKQADIDPATVTYIEAHGTGTELGDPVEVEGLKNAFSLLLSEQSKKSSPFCGLGSVKTNIGHLEPASGMAGMIKVLLAMKNGTIPGNLHFNAMNSYIKLSDSPFYLVNKTEEWRRLKDETGNFIPRRAGVSSFGFGGTCAHVVLEEMMVPPPESNEENKSYLIALSAKQEESLHRKMADLFSWLQKNISTVTLSALSYTLNAGRAHFEYRCVFIVNTLEELVQSLNAMIQENPPLPFLVDRTAQTQHLQLLAKQYLQGSTIDWDNLYSKKQRVASLPPYPFVKKRFWFDAEFSKDSFNPPETLTTENFLCSQSTLEAYTLQYLQKIFAEKLRLSPEQIEIHETYEVYGIDSLLSVEITERLEKDLGPLPKTLLYEQNQLSLLAKYCLKNCSPTLEKMCGSFEKTLPSSLTAKDDNHSFKKNMQQKQVQNIDNEIAIVGISIHFPLAKNLREFWSNLLLGRDCISEIPPDRWDYRDYPILIGEEKKYFKYGGFISDIDKFDPLFFNISPREAMLMDPQERLFLQTAWSVIEDAGYTRQSLQQTVNNEVGVFAGATYNFYPLLIAEEWSRGNQLPLDIQMFSIANRVSYCLNFKGPSYVVDTACSSSLSAIHLACESLLRRECQAAIAGGVNLSLHPTKYHFLGGYSFLSEKGRCESFGQGEGYVPSEGVGAVLLKPLALAKRDRDRIYGVIKSSSMNHGAKTSGYTVPNPNAQAELILNALQKANIDPRTISYIEAHGTGTSLGDPIEIRGLQEAFDNYTNDKQFCAIGSVKSNIGHLESAAGISQLAKVLLQMQHKQLVPSIHTEKLNPYINFDQTAFFVQRDVSNWQTPKNMSRRAGISSFGAGGTNVHVIVEEFIDQPMVQSLPNLPFLLLLSAQNIERLQEYVKQVSLFLAAESKQYLQSTGNTILNEWLYNLCYTSQIGRESMAARLAIMANTYDELVDKLQSYHEAPEQKISGTWTNPATKISKTSENVTELIMQRKLEQLAQLWVSGIHIMWDKLYVNYIPKRIAFPTYPFAKRRCWVTAEKPVKNVSKEVQETWIIFNDKELGYHLQQNLPNSIHCFVNQKFAASNPVCFYINPEELNHYELLFRSLTSDNTFKVKGIIYLWPAEYVPLMLAALNQLSWPNNLIVLLARRKGAVFNFDTIKNKYKFVVVDLEQEKSLVDSAVHIMHRLQRGEEEDLPEPNDKVMTSSPEKNIALILDLVAKLLALDVNEIELNEPFLNYGMDSILGINFVAQLDKFFPDLLTPMDLYRYSTVELLANYITQSYQPLSVENKINNPDTFPEEAQFLETISQLSTDQVNQLLEDELLALDTLLAEGDY